MKKRKLKVYLDTSVISAIFDVKAPERLWWTQELWKSIDEFDIFISDVVLTEIQETPDLELRGRMMEISEDLKVLEIDEESEWLSREYIQYGAVPERYRSDALHIGIATVNEMDVLISWNYKHIVRRKTKKIVRMINELYDYQHLEIMAPPEILGGEQ